MHVILHQATECRSNRSTAEIWRHICFSIWRPRPLNTTSGFVFVDVTAFRKSKSISKPNFFEISLLAAEITTSGFEIQTSAILKFYFWYWFRPVRCNLHVILHQATEFRPNQSTRCGNKTSYQFVKMAAAIAKYNFRFVFVDVTAFRRSKSISKPNFVEISQMTAEI